MDDVVDYLSDLKRKRHNYLVSLAQLGSHPAEKHRLQELIEARPTECHSAAKTTDFSYNSAEELGVKEQAALRFASPSLGRPLKLTVVGIYRTEIERLDRGVVFCPLEALPLRNRSWS